MPIRGKHLSDEEKLALYDALVESGQTASKVAQEVGVNEDTAYRARKELMRLGLEFVKKEERQDTPEERHDSAFWRSKANRLQKDLDGLHKILREIGTLDGLTIRAPNWFAGTGGGRRGRATLCIHNSDRHRGEVIAADEINGWNTFNHETHDRRVKRLMDAACEIGRRWGEDVEIDGVLYTMGGDEISGDIHDELVMTNEVTSLEEVQGAAEIHAAGIRQLANEYGRVHVMAVPGNHGRLTKKSTAKKYGALSFDIMIAKLVAKELRDDERVSFQIASGADVWTTIYHRPVLLTHGDKIGTGGGQGFIGPAAPIFRGVTKIRAQYATMGLHDLLVLLGHFHTSIGGPSFFANGSVPGISEYGFGIRGAVDVPKQWMFLLHEKWGVRERMDVKLEEPPMPDKPRVRA